MTRRPWFPFYPADWKESRKVRAMPRAVRDMYRELLGEIWLEGPIPNDAEAVRLLLAEPKRGWEKVWPMLRGALQPAHEVIVHGSPLELTDDRLEVERQRAEEKSQEQRDRALKRHHGMPRHMPAHVPRHMPDVCGEPCRDDARSQITDHIQREEALETASAAPAEQAKFKLEEPKPKRSPKPPSPEQQDTVDVLAHYRQAWIDRMRPADGKPPSVGGADWKQLKTVVKEHGRETSTGFVDRFLADADPFLFSVGYALRHLPGRLNSYRATARAPDPKSRLGAPPRTNNHPPSAEQRKRDYEESSSRDSAERRKRMEAEGYRWTDDGRWYDPDGNELDDKARPVAKITAAS